MNDVFGTFRCPQCGIRGRVIKVKFDKKTKSRVNHQKRSFYWQLICPLDGCNVTKLPHPEPDYYKKEGDFCGECCYFHTFQCDRGKLHLRTSDPCEKFRRKTYNNSSKKEVVAMVEKEVAAFVDYREQKVVIGTRSQVTKHLLACDHECEIYANVEVLPASPAGEKPTQKEETEVANN